MFDSLPAASEGEKQHLTEIFATVNGFAVKDLHQIFHPSTQLRPAIDPTRTHWHEHTEFEDVEDSEADLEERYVRCKPTRCTTGVECVGNGCDMCIIAHDMSARYCHHGDY